MKYLHRISREVARIADGEYSVWIYAGDGVDYTDATPVETVGEALLIFDLLEKSTDRTFYVFYDDRGLRITENGAEAPEGALVIDGGKFFVNQTIFKPEPPPEKWKFRKPRKR